MFVSCRIRVYSKSTLCNCLNAKEFLAQSRRVVWNLSDCKRIGTQNYLVFNRALNHLSKLSSLTKWSSVRLRPEWLWVAIPLQSLKCPGQTVKNFSPQSICVSAFKPAPILCVCNYLNPYYERQTMYLFQLILQYDLSLWVIHISVIQSSLWLWNRK